jgi:hypothetical protein
MAGVLTTAGKNLVGQLLCKKDVTDRDADLKMGLFTNSSGLSAASVLGDITVPTGTGYGAKTLTDASWTGSTNTKAYAEQTFTGGAGGWSGAIYGYYIFTQSAGGTPRLVFYEIDAGAPYTINEGDTYKVTPTITFA